MNLLAPGPCTPFVLAHRALAAALLLGVTLEQPALPAWLVAVLAALGLLALLRVPRRLRALELALAFAVLGAWSGATVWAALGALPLVSCLLAPESALARMNGMDRFFVAQDYPGCRCNSHVVVDTQRAPDRAALERAVDALGRDVPLLRSFVREAWLGVERFVTAAPWTGAREHLTWLDAAPAEPDRLLDAPFDLARAPAWRVLVLPHGGGWRLVLTVHHSLADGTGQFVLLDMLLRRLAGAPLEAEERRRTPPRLRELLRPHGLHWLVRMIRRHVHPLAKFGVKNASLLEREEARADRTLDEVVTLDEASLSALGPVADAHGVSRNLLLLAASLRAGADWRAARGLPARPWKVLLPTDLRPTLGLAPSLGNYVGSIPVELSPEEVDRPDLPRLIAERARLGRALDEAIEAPVNLGVVSALLPPWLFRRELRRFDTDPDTFFFSFLFSAIRPLEELTLPDDLGVERVWVRGSLPEHPGFGLVLTRDRANLHLAVEYRAPLTTPAAVADYVERLRTALRALTPPTAAA